MANIAIVIHLHDFI